MAYDYIRERTTAIGTGGLLKRIWYAMTGTTQGLELASLDDTGKFKCVSEQISGLAGTGTRMVVADATGNLTAGTQTIKFAVGTLNTTPISTGISINAGPGGKTIMAYYSTHSGAGDDTNSTVTMIRCGYDANNFSTTKIASSGMLTVSPIYTQVNGVLHVATETSATAIVRIKFDFND